MKKLIIALLGVILGAVSTFSFIYFFYENEVSKFVDLQIIMQERISVDAFNNYPPESSNFVQINYGVFIKEAYDAGLISDFEYNRSASMTNTRLCINYEHLRDSVRASQFCKWAEEHLSLWRSDIGFEEFKNTHFESLNRKEIPIFSQEIISNINKR